MLHLPKMTNVPAPLLDAQVILELVRFMRRERFDIVHTHETKAGFVGRVAARLAGVPIIVHSVHGWGFGSLRIWWLDSVLRALERLTGRWCDAVFFVTDALRQQAIDLGIGRPETFQVAYSGIDIERYAAPSREARLGHRGAAPRLPVVAMIARLAPGKGHDTFVEAISQAVDRLSGTRFWLVGDGESTEDIRTEIRERGLADRVELLGKRDDVPELLAEVDVVVRMLDRKAVYREGIPRTIIESLAAGKAVIAADVGGVREILDHGRNGIVIPPNDARALAEALVHVCSDPALRDRLSITAQESVGSRFHYRTMVRQIHDTYLQLADRACLMGERSSCRS
jgi:glycosyltransferase involved in cell wall biosynthesis